MNGGRDGVDDEGTGASEGIAAGEGGEAECSVVTGAVLDGGAVEGEGGGGPVVEIVGAVAVLNGVGEAEGVGTGAGGIGGVAVGGSGFKGECGCAASGVDGDVF